MTPKDWARLPEPPPADIPARQATQPQLVVLMERPRPASWSLRQVTRLARRLGAELLVAAVVTYDRGLDELDQVHLRVAREGVRDVTTGFVEQGVPASGEVRLAACGEQALEAADLTDRLDPDLVIVLARRGSWFGLFPGSPLAHHLMRRGHRPVLVIPDYEARQDWRGALSELIRVAPPRE